MIYRMKFEKRDEVKYIGHLDTMRTFTRCIKKTSLPIKFSTGFNPRVQLAFALPLAVGVTSECEYFDLELNGDIECQVVIDELNKSLPSGFKVISCEKMEHAKGLMSLVKEAIYEVTVSLTNETNNETALKQIENVFIQEQVIVEKQGKNNQIENVDIKPLIIDYDISSPTYNCIVVRVHCLAGSSRNLNPNLIVNAIKKALSENDFDDYNIHRIELILNT